MIAKMSLKKVNLRSFNFYRDYSYPVTLSNSPKLSLIFSLPSHRQILRYLLPITQPFFVLSATFFPTGEPLCDGTRNGCV